MRLFQDLTDEINHFPQQQQSTGAMTLQEVALGFIRVANETMCRPIRALTQVIVMYTTCSGFVKQIVLLYMHVGNNMSLVFLFDDQAIWVTCKFDPFIYLKH